MQKNTAEQCLAVAVRILRIPIDKERICDIYEHVQGKTATAKLVNAAGKAGARAKRLCPNFEQFTKLSKLSIAVMQDGSFLIVIRIVEDNVIIIDLALDDKPRAVSKAEFSQHWSGEIVLLDHPFTLHGLFRRFNLDWFIPVIAKFKLYLSEVVVASCLLQLFGLVTPLFTQVVIDKVILYNGQATLDVLAISLLFMAVFHLIISIFRTYISTHATNKIDIILTSKLFRQLVKLPLRYFETRRVGDILMRIGGLNSIREFLTGSSISIILDALFSVIFIAVMAHYSLLLTGIALLAIPVYFLQNVIATPVYRRRLEKMWAAGAENNAFMVEAVTGIQTIKALAVEPQFNSRWEKLIPQYVGTYFSTAMINLVITNASQLIQKISTVSILWVGGHLAMDGVITVGQLVAFQMLANQTNAPIIRLVNMWQTIQKTALAVDRLQDIINTPPEWRASSVQPSALLKGNIRFSNVNFNYYVDTPPVLKDISFTIPPGACVGIVGPSGSGKSTLTKLIQRLYVPSSGQVTIDDLELAQVNPAWLRRQIGVILQDNYLFSGSVRDNIAAAMPAAPMGEVVKAAKAAAAHEFILELPEGYDTNVGERGTFLSGGQRQRIAIARTLLAHPRILIMDEATSALDYETEREVFQNIRRMGVGRTTIIIAHRFSAIKKCDFIIVLENGRVVEVGSHQDLLDTHGLYYNLYRQQEG